MATADVRVYRTTDGKLVGEHDPRGAFLAYAVGDDVPVQYAEAYERVRRGDEYSPSREALRAQQVEGINAGADGERVYIHDRLATALADEQRVIAQAPDDIRVAVIQEESDTPVTDRRLYRTEDGELVNEGDARAVTLAYAVGDRIRTADMQAYDEYKGEDKDGGKADGSTQDGESGEGQDQSNGDGTTPRKAATTKARPASPNK